MENLDAMSADKLMEFWMRHQNGRAYKKLFPQGGKGSKLAAADLANYAANKATAMRLRVAGNIDAALTYEAICERIYARLPLYARW